MKITKLLNMTRSQILRIIFCSIITLFIMFIGCYAFYIHKKKNKYDMTPFIQRLKNKYYSWKWKRKERKTKLYDSDSEFITYAYPNGFIHSPFHYAKIITDFAPVIGNPDFNTLFDINVKSGIFIPVKKELIT